MATRTLIVLRSFGMILTLLATSTTTIKVENKTRVAIITSDNQVDILDGATGQSLGSNRLSAFKGHPYGVGLTGSEVRILSQLNKKFYVSRVKQDDFQVIDNYEITSDKGQFQKIQNVLFIDDDVFVYDEIFGTVFRSNSTEKLFSTFKEIDDKITSLEFDPCRQNFFWSTETSINIFSVVRNISDVLVNDLSNVRSISIDRRRRKLYWMSRFDQLPNKNNFRLESADLNGHNRHVICRTSATFDVVVKKFVTDRKNMFFADWKNRVVWKLEKNDQIEDDQDCKLIRLNSSSTLKPIDISVFEPDLCSNETEENPSQDFFTTAADLISAQPLTTNSGGVNPSSGPDPCHNFCFTPDDRRSANVTCKISLTGNPVCSCPKGFEGRRCQINVCRNFCLNDGVCQIDDASSEPSCKCQSRFSGDRCQLAYSPTNSTGSESISRPQFNSNSDFFFAFVACLVSSSILAITLFFVVFYFLFRRRSNLASLQTVTIVKKSRSRVFSSSSASRDKNSRQHNFVTSSCDAKPVSQPVTCPNGVILDLEDCCQMTLCDQPCAEALFRKPNHRKNRITKDIGGDTDALLDNETIS